MIENSIDSAPGIEVLRLDPPTLSKLTLIASSPELLSSRRSGREVPAASLRICLGMGKKGEIGKGVTVNVRCRHTYSLKGARQNDKRRCLRSTLTAVQLGWCTTFSATKRKPFSGRTSSYVSPKRGLKGFLEPRYLTVE